MVRISSLVLVLAAASVSASPATPSFELSAAQLQESASAMRGAQVKARTGDLKPRIIRMTLDLQRCERSALRLRRELGLLVVRLREYKTKVGRVNNDPTLSLDVQRFTQDLAQLARDSQRSLNDLRFLASQAEKDEALVAPVSGLLDVARRFKNATSRLRLDARSAYPDFVRVGFTFEGMDMDRDSRDVDEHARDLQDEADQLLAKVRD